MGRWDVRAVVSCPWSNGPSLRLAAAAASSATAAYLPYTAVGVGTSHIKQAAPRPRPLLFDMSGHAPYIMPDGRSLAAVLRAEGPAQSSSKQQRKQARPKDELWGQLQHNKRSALSEAELSEIRAIERVGHRRRKQWLNDKLLRDLAGPMSTQDMEAQFKPIPFGVTAPPSVFTVASAPEHAAVWDHFRSIDSDKQARVLQAWEAHNAQQQQQQRHDSSHPSDPQAAALTATAAAALAKWSRVERGARSALKKASVHTVLAFEAQALKLLDEGDPSSQLLLELPDSFARLLVHGLAQFHNLQSTTQCTAGGQKSVVLQCKHSSSTGTGAAAGTAASGTTTSSTPSSATSSTARISSTADASDGVGGLLSIQAGMGLLQVQQQQQQQQQDGVHLGGSSSASDSTVKSAEQAAAAAAVESASVDSSSRVSYSHSAAEPGIAAVAVAAAAADWLSQSLDITCTDIIMALQELGDNSLNHHSLQDYIRTVHSLSPHPLGCSV